MLPRLLLDAPPLHFIAFFFYIKNKPLLQFCTAHVYSWVWNYLLKNGLSNQEPHS